jgi:hypothetical protein
LEDSTTTDQCGIDDLKNFAPLILFMKSFYSTELKDLENAEGISSRAMPSARSVYDALNTVREKTADKFARSLFMNPLDFVHNIMNNSLDKVPPP